MCPSREGTPAPLAGIGSDVAWPSVRADRLVHVQLVPSPWGIWRIPGRRSSVGDRRPERLIASRWNDSVPAYSPDGHRIAFNSDRSGTMNIWVSDEDGTDPAQLTTFHSLIGDAGAPWSPDGRRIVFTSKESGSWDVYVVDSEGGAPRRLSYEPSDDGPGTFSRDGRSIYFASDRTGRSQIWKMPAGGGPAVQLTRRGGVDFYFQESWDARHVYYSNAGGGEIWRVPVEGGEETPVLQRARRLERVDALPSRDLLCDLEVAVGGEQRIRDPLPRFPVGQHGDALPQERPLRPLLARGLARREVDPLQRAARGAIRADPRRELQVIDPTVG